MCTTWASMRALQCRKPDARPSVAVHRPELPCIVFAGLPCRCAAACARLLFGRLARMHYLISLYNLGPCFVLTRGRQLRKPDARLSRLQLGHAELTSVLHQVFGVADAAHVTAHPPRGRAALFFLGHQTIGAGIGNPLPAAVLPHWPVHGRLLRPVPGMDGARNTMQGSSGLCTVWLITVPLHSTPNWRPIQIRTSE